MSGRLWTVIIDPDTGIMVDAFNQDEPGCGMGPNTCGGCIDCMIAQCGENMTIKRDVTDDEFKELKICDELDDLDWLIFSFMS